MRYVILLVILSMFMACSSKKPLKSISEDASNFEDTVIPEKITNGKFTEAVLLNKETGKVCSIDLRGKADLQLPFVNSVAEHDETPFQKVSVLENPVLCNAENEQRLAMLTPQVVYGENFEGDTLLASTGVISALAKQGVKCYLIGMGFIGVPLALVDFLLVGFSAAVSTRGHVDKEVDDLINAKSTGILTGIGAGVIAEIKGQTIKGSIVCGVGAGAGASLIVYFFDFLH